MSRFFALAMLPLLVAGCNSGDAVRSYTVPRATEAAAKAAPATGPVRLLGAVIPMGDGKYSWFVKFAGPADVVGGAEKEFDAFLASMKFTGDAADKELKWKAPEGWTADPKPRAMRTGTFLVGPPGKAVELYVSTPMGGGLIENINRWRTGDVGVPSIATDDLPTCTSEVTIDGVKCLKVDMSGPGVPKDKKRMGMDR